MCGGPVLDKSLKCVGMIEALVGNVKDPSQLSTLRLCGVCLQS